MVGNTLRADKYAYILVRNNEIMIGGGSSTKAQIRMYATFDKAIKMRDRYFRNATIKRVVFEDIGDEMFKPYGKETTNDQ